MSYYTDQKRARQLAAAQAKARKQYIKQLIWFTVAFVAFVLILGIIGHIEYNDLKMIGQSNARN